MHAAAYTAVSLASWPVDSDVSPQVARTLEGVPTNRAGAGVILRYPFRGSFCNFFNNLQNIAGIRRLSLAVHKYRLAGCNSELAPGKQ